MKPVYILLYSGGVDSILCLKWLVERGIAPFIFHFKTRKLKRYHERMIRKTARMISPESPFYVFITKTMNYKALWSKNGEYHVLLNDKGPKISMLLKDYGDIIVIGYTGYAPNDGRRRLSTQKLTIEQTKEYGFPYVFPLANMRSSEIYKLWKSLPREIRNNTVSSTRFLKSDEWTLVIGKR